MGAVDSEGRTALAYAMTLDKRETLACAEALLACGALTKMPGPPPGRGVEILDITGESWVHRAVRYGAYGECMCPASGGSFNRLPLSWELSGKVRPC